MCCYRCKIPCFVSDPEHTHCKRRQEISIGECVDKPTTIAKLVVHLINRGNRPRLAYDIADDLQRGRQRHTIADQKAKGSNDPGRPPITHRPSNPGNRAQGSHNLSPPPTVHKNEADTEDECQAHAEKEIKVGTQPVGRRQNKSRTCVQSTSKVLEHGLKLRNDIYQKEYEDDHCRRDQKKRITDCGTKALAEELLSRSIFDNCL